MLSLLVQPTMFILKKHLALSGLVMSNNVVLESNGLDIEENLPKVQKGKNSLGIIYNRGKIRKLSRDVDFNFYDKDSSRHTKRKGFNCSIPFEISIVTDQLESLDNMELIHRMHLVTKTYGFEVVIPGIADNVEKIPYGLYYRDLPDKSDLPITGNLKDGFRYYNFTLEVNGILLAPYIEQINIVSNVVFKLIPYDGNIASIPDESLNDGNSVTLNIPKV